MLVDDKWYDLDEEDDKDSEIYDIMEYKHECDKEAYTFDKTVNPFFNKLSGISSTNGQTSDDDEANRNILIPSINFHVLNYLFCFKLAWPWRGIIVSQRGTR